MKKEMFMSKAELVRSLPWSSSAVSRMIRNGVFHPVRNPAASPGRTKMFFWRPQVEEAIQAMLGAEVELSCPPFDEEKE